ncbi:alpha-galactosidase [Arthrobacter sp. H14-L1]|uniref:alpha-galactosidase n=1 Tax=Arthrobacter sp. H14-L1 TaxID=2996697 RepID=UPI00227165CA|nr:alpha-galactosidase [Arthrobacter sp. H14-L1]MCY0904034.1 alpha-galactosidase [Arthrobacter sp. H14-L1]
MNPIYLRAAGVSLLIDLSSGEPSVLHWGADLGGILPDLSLAGVMSGPVPHSALDIPVVLGLLPQASSGWRGRPGLRGHRLAAGNGGRDGVDGDALGIGVDRDGTRRGFSARLRLTGCRATERSAVITTADAQLGLTVVTEVTLHDGGLLELRHHLTNDGGTDYALEELAAVLPVGPEATEILDLTGRWCRERHPQRHSVQQGTWLRSARHGRTGHDSSLLLAAGSLGFGNRQGKVWATHFAWSGDHEAYLESLADGRSVLGASELVGSGEIVLAPGESYLTPALFAAYSSHGLDGISDAFYAWFRGRSKHPSTPRPVVLNTWEAVYFNHDLTVLTSLADAAADLGVERFVLDDGWFRHRRDDHAGLGDWYVDPNVWPEGLHPLIAAVTDRGMEFGLWVEPEMINSDSDAARAHPDWIAGPGSGLPLQWRHQQVLDLVNPQAWQYIYDRLDALLSEYRIFYLKWDQNRDLSEMGHAGGPSVHEQTLAAYRLLDALRAAHPGVEIESCSSGGARADLGILQRTDRIWASDCNDALERQTIQRWTSMIVPPELVGAHVGPPTSHTTGRTHTLSFRAITALFGHFGLEWDIRSLTGPEHDELRGVIELYKEHRTLLHTGRMVRADLPDPALLLHGVVAGDGSEALFALVATSTSFSEQPGRVAIPGLAPELSYRVEVIYPRPLDPDREDPGVTGRDAASTYLQTSAPAWLATGVVASGQFLSESGLPMPILNPEHAILLHISAA